MSKSVTHEDVQQEFRSQFREAISQECRSLADQLHREIKKELRRFLDEESSLWARRSRSIQPPSTGGDHSEDRMDNRVRTPPTQFCPPLGVDENDPALRSVAWATPDEMTSLQPLTDYHDSHSKIAGWSSRLDGFLDELPEKDADDVESLTESFKSRNHSKVHPAPEESSSNASPSQERSQERGARSASTASRKRASYHSRYSEKLEVLPGDSVEAPDQMLEAWLPEKVRNSQQMSRFHNGPLLEEVESENSNQWWSQGQESFRLSNFGGKIAKKFKTKDGRCSCRKFWNAAIKSEWFDYIMGVFLLLNAVSIGIQVNYMAGQESGEVPTEFRIIDGCFCLVFAFELLARFAVFRRKYFYMRGWQWNVFDLVVVLFQVFDEASKLFLEGTGVQETLDSGGGSKVLRIVRLARLVRLLRMVRLIPELKSMVYLISASMWSFFWTAVLLLMLIFCVAVYFTELSTELVFENRSNSRLGLQDVENIQAHYGSIGNSIFSLFQAISGGDDWRNFIDPFQADGSYLQNAMVFSAYVAFATLVMLNLVTGVFVEGAQRIVQTDKDLELVRHVRKLFAVTDSNHSGEISWDEFESQLNTHKMDAYLKQLEIGKSEAKALFKLLDTDKSGEVSVEEFVQGCLRLRGPARSMDLNALKYDFDELTAMWGRRFITIDLNIRHLKMMMEQLARAAVTIPVEHVLV